MSTLAFMLALGGGAAIAKQALLNGRDIRPRSVPANRIVKHSLTGKEINLGRLGVVPNARHASTADTARSATHAATAGMLGGQGPAAFEPRVRWALVDQHGNIISQSGGLTVDHAGTGEYVFGLGQSVSGVTVSTTGAYAFDDVARVDISADKCGTNSAAGDDDCAADFSIPQYDDGQHLLIRTADSYSSTSGTNDEGFYIDFIS
jgi:hypothetical protein